MSAEVTTMDLDARRRARSVDGTLGEVDVLLETTFAELSDALRRAAEGTGDGSTADPLRDLPGHDPGPLGVDLVGELADRARNHGKRLRPVLAHWGWAVAGGRSDSHPQLVRVAAALELLHLFALIQDDVMDRSASRRGLPTLHVVAAERHRDAGRPGRRRPVRRQRRHPGVRPRTERGRPCSSPAPRPRCAPPGG